MTVDCILFVSVFQVACVQLINALVSTPDDLDFRLHLRNEFVREGLNDPLQVHVHVTFKPSWYAFDYHALHRFEMIDVSVTAGLKFRKLYLLSIPFTYSSCLLKVSKQYLL